MHYAHTNAYFVTYLDKGYLCFCSPKIDCLQYRHSKPKTNAHFKSPLEGLPIAWHLK
ncbi:hypothetical protein HBZC1_10020 [Helicobacter bizzozeronii CIII-1]|uniref:Uncharacterized protein n=1 Tax=Helicobacter bizzozeronii (strain CIII-1) TaxID=1002804 RepID=F8KT43_HELBC|nr:hypothetical protein HBZC1_10020 [Helicobacter bizzozeronii CIII-1]